LFGNRIEFQHELFIETRGVEQKLESHKSDVNSLRHLNSPELETRLLHLKALENQGEGFLQVDWIWLILLGIVGPIVLLIWGWVS
jgi:hypothetical protein